MSTRVREHIRRNVWGIAAVFIALGGTAHATHPGGADTISTEDIIDGQVRAADIGTAQVRSGDVRDDTLPGGGLAAADLGAGSVESAEVADESLAAVDLAGSSVGTGEIQTDGVQATEVANNSIDSGEIVDFGLSNQDVGVLYAVVNNNGTLARSSGGVASAPIGTSTPGDYRVDFGRTVTGCAVSAVNGSPGAQPIGVGIVGVQYDLSDSQDVIVKIWNHDAVASNGSFHLVVVC
jgi:hypothetical protein